MYFCAEHDMLTTPTLCMLTGPILIIILFQLSQFITVRDVCSLRVIYIDNVVH